MNHEKLKCYRMLIDIAAKIGVMVKRWPRGYGYLSDQIQRAIASAVLNLAEGNGKQAGHKERHRFFKVSLGSLSEVSACLDLGLAFSLITPMEVSELKSLLALSYASIKRLP